MYEEEKEMLQGQNIEEGAPAGEVPVKRSHPFLKKIGLAACAGVLCGAVVSGAVIGYSIHRESEKGVVSQNGNHASGSVQNMAISNGDGTLSGTNVSNTTTVYDVSAVVKNVTPAIVSINGTGVTVQYDLFGRAYERETGGSGSGIIVAQDGDSLLIVTNNHVVSGMNSLEVVFADGTVAPAAVKGTEENDDLAVIVVKFSELSEETLNNIRIATLGSSDSLEEGEMVIAIGNALGYGQSTTVGYVSAVNREIEIEGITMNLIQTCAAINPGNSGGALLNAKGQVIGINNAKLVSESVEGVGYAIPISHAIPVINDLMNREELREEERAYIGIDGKDVTEELSLALNLPVGVYISAVEEGSPAEKAGIRPYSVLTAVNGRSVSTREELKNLLAYTRGGSAGTVTVQELINGAYVEKTYEITFGRRP